MNSSNDPFSDLIEQYTTPIPKTIPSANENKEKEQISDPFADLINSVQKNQETLKVNPNIPGFAGKVMQLYPEAPEAHVPFYARSKNRPPLLDYIMQKWTGNLPEQKNVVQTFMGNLPRPNLPLIGEDEKYFINPETVNEVLYQSLGTPGMKIVGQPTLGSMGKEFIKNAMQKSARAKALKEAEQAHTLATGEEQEAKSLARVEAGAKDIDTLKRNVAQNEDKLKTINKDLSEMKVEKPSNLPIQSAQESERLLNEARNVHQQQTENLTEADQRLGQFLNRGAVHDVDAAEQLFNMHDARRAEISNEYNNIIDDFRNNNVSINNSREIQHSMNRLRELTQQNLMHTQEFRRLAEEINRLQSVHGGQIPADEYLTMLRTAQHDARIARQNAFRPGMRAEERSEYEHQFNDLENQIATMESNLINSIGPENSTRLRNANRSWAREVIPLQRNNIYQTIRYEGKMPANIMRELRGTEPGNLLMRNSIRNNQALARNVIGQRFADNPEELRNIGRLEREYTQQIPELQNLLNSYTEAERSAQDAANTVSRAERNHQNILEQQRKSDKLITKEEEKIKKSKEEIESKKSQKEQVEKQIKLLQDHIDELERLAAKKDITLKEKTRLEAELKKSKQAMKKLKMIGYGALISGAIGLPSTIKNIISAIKGSD